MNPVIEYYKAIFENDFKASEISTLGQTPSGHTEMCGVKIFGFDYTLMSTDKEHHPLNDAVSLILHCDGQNEIDLIWNYFTREGKAAQCGWCLDKFGLRWQVIPENMGTLMRQPNAMNVMMNQTKIVIDEYLR